VRGLQRIGPAADGRGTHAPPLAYVPGLKDGIGRVKCASLDELVSLARRSATVPPQAPRAAGAGSCWPIAGRREAPPVMAGGPQGPPAEFRRGCGYLLPMTKLKPGSLEPLYFASPAPKPALSEYVPGFWVSLMSADAVPVESVVPTVTVFDGAEYSGPV
jgi:hypothetical protein